MEVCGGPAVRWLMLRAFVLLALAPSGCSASRSSPVELLARRHWGVNIHSNSWSPSSAALLRTAFTAIRQDFAWADIEKQRGVYDWSTYETLLDQLGPGVVPYIILDYGNALYGTNATASNDWIVIEKNNTVASEAFVKFAVAAMRRFKGKGVMWELWNETNGQWCCGHLEVSRVAAATAANLLNLTGCCVAIHSLRSTANWRWRSRPKRPSSHPS